MLSSRKILDWWKAPVCITQIVAYPFVKFVSAIIVRSHLDVSRRFKLKKGASYVIYSNHQSKIDPFLILASLPFETCIKLLPFRLFVNNAFFSNYFNVLFLRIFGGFPAHHNDKRPYGLDYARILLASGQTVVIFPQGTRTREKIVKSGIAVLAKEPNVYLIPIYLDWKNRLTCYVKIGQPFKALNSQADQLIDHLYKI